MTDYTDLEVPTGPDLDLAKLRAAWHDVKVAFFEFRGDSAEALACMQMDLLLWVNDDDSPIEQAQS